MRFVTLLLLAFMIGCSSSPQWVASALRTHLPEHDSLRMLHETEDPQGMDIAFYQLKDGLHVYLQVHGQGFLVDRNDPKRISIILRTDNSVYHGYAICHRGQQRAVLSQDLKETLMTLLQKNDEITIEAGGYHESISPKGFSLTKKFSLMPKFLLF